MDNQLIVGVALGVAGNFIFFVLPLVFIFLVRIEAWLLGQLYPRAVRLALADVIDGEIAGRNPLVAGWRCALLIPALPWIVTAQAEAENDPRTGTQPDRRVPAFPSPNSVGGPEQVILDELAQELLDQAVAQKLIVSEMDETTRKRFYALAEVRLRDQRRK